MHYAWCLVVCKARPGSNAPARARLLGARALRYPEPSPSQKLKLGSSRARAQAGAWGVTLWLSYLLVSPLLYLLPFLSSDQSKALMAGHPWPRSVHGPRNPWPLLACGFWERRCIPEPFKHEFMTIISTECYQSNRWLTDNKTAWMQSVFPSQSRPIERVLLWSFLMWCWTLWALKHVYIVNIVVIWCS